ncbi:MAG: FAD-dependent oxidoreductase, partial [Williamsia herbipolensis]|nr:FAD-dependent oxidoreductase [Williamsia herbipolensis]
ERTGAVDHGRADVLHAIVAAFVEAGVPHERLTPVEAAERWPGLVFDDAVVAHAAGGRIRSAAALDAFLDLATADGADLRFDHGVRSVTVVEDDAVVVLDDGRTIRTPSLVVAAGSWVPTLVGDVLRERGARLPAVTVTEEQPAHFPGHVADDSWPSFVHYPQDGGDVYGLLTPGEGVKVGFHGTGPIVHPDERTFRPTEDGADALRRYVGRWVPGVDAERATPVSCLYDNTPDGDFVIDRTGPVTVATGFSGHGFKFAPVLGELVADLALGGTALPRFAFRD